MDLTPEEFRSIYLGFLGKKSESTTNAVFENPVQNSVDWRANNILNSVKD
jgi:hypothetical protein